MTDLDRYAGRYENRMYGEVVIKLDEGKPSFEHGPSFGGKIDPWNYDTFRASFKNEWVAKMLVTFSLGPDGKSPT